jgi:hypothetical protein
VNAIVLILEALAIVLATLAGFGVGSRVNLLCIAVALFVLSVFLPLAQAALG